MSQPKCARCKTNDAEGFMWIDGSNCCGPCVGYRPFQGMTSVWFEPAPAKLRPDEGAVTPETEDAGTKDNCCWFCSDPLATEEDFYKSEDGDLMCQSCFVRLSKRQPRAVQPFKLQQAAQPETRSHSHYYKPVGHLQTVDWYRVATLFEITCPALAHAGKKIAFAGKRGLKDQRKDIQEAIDTLQRKLQMMDEDEKT